MDFDGQYCLGGITRANLITICRENGIPVFEKSFSLTDVYGADEAFVTGTFGGVVPVHTVDQRTIGEAARGDDARGPMSSGCNRCIAHSPRPMRPRACIPHECFGNGRAGRGGAGGDVVGAAQYFHGE